MSKDRIIWKRAKESFIVAYDLALDVVNAKLSLSDGELKALLKILESWIDALDVMIDDVADAEMKKDFQIYLEKMKSLKQNFLSHY